MRMDDTKKVQNIMEVKMNEEKNNRNDGCDCRNRKRADSKCTC